MEDYATKSLFLTSLVLLLKLTGCISTPTSFDYHGRELSVFSLGCNKPYTLDQDCSGMSGAKRLINFDGKLVKIAGSADGTTVMIMNDRAMNLETAKIKTTAAAIEAHLISQGATVLETMASAGNGEVAAMLFVFDQDVYTELKTFTVE